MQKSVVGVISQDYDYIHTNSQIDFWKAVLTGVHFSADVLGEGGNFPSAYLNNWDPPKSGSHTPKCQNLHFYSLLHPPAKKTQGKETVVDFFWRNCLIYSI